MNNKNTVIESIDLKDKSGASYRIVYKIVRSNRRTCSIELEKEGTLTLRMPQFASSSDAVRILMEKQFWIGTKLAEQRARNASAPEASKYTESLLSALEKRYRHAAGEYIPRRTSYFAEKYYDIIKKSYSHIAIRDQKTRWGSCSSKGCLSFNWRLMLAPPVILDYVIVHELCHLAHMNHSRDFWQSVAAILPDYKEHRKWLKEHGQELTLSYFL